MVSWTDFKPGNLRRAWHDGNGNLRAGCTTQSYSGGDPAAAGDIKSSIVDRSGKLRRGLCTGAELCGSMKPAAEAAGGGWGGVETGLQLHLDAGDASSYSGSGTTWSDLTPNGNDATLINGPVFDGDEAGGSFSFDGTNDVVKIPSDSSIENGDTYTLEIWTTIDVGGGANNILWYKDNVLLWWDHAGRDDTYYARQRMSFGGEFDSGWKQNTTGNDTYPNPPTPWLHWAHTYDSATGDGKLYMDGVLVYTAAWDAGANTMLESALNTYLMSGNESGNQPTLGKVAVVRMYDVTLTGAQVEENYDAQSSRFGH